MCVTVSYSSKPRCRQQGYVLVATLWITALMAIAASFLATWTEKGVAAAQQQLTDIQHEIDMQSTQATVLYLLNTHYLTEGGLLLTDIPPALADDPFAVSLTVDPNNSIPLDDQAVLGVNGTLFSLQDEGGLISANLGNTELFSNLLGVLNIAPEDKGGLLAKLQDYQDKDSLTQLNGAEARDYARAGRLPPANRYLLTRWELSNVLSWQDYPQLWQDHRLPRLITTVLDGLPNFNTAPKQVLQSWPGIDATHADLLINFRKKMPFKDLTQIYPLLGKALYIDPLTIGFAPSRNLRLSLWHKNSEYMREVLIELKPQSKGETPWQIDYQIDIAQTEQQRDAKPKEFDNRFFAKIAETLR